MKKRLLITSIVMMLVVAVALGTSTYAWFTSNATVKASEISLRAATNDAEALGIGWLGGEASSYITYNVTGTLSPMAPEALTADTTSQAGTASTVAFHTATTREEASQIVFNKTGEAVSTATPVVYNNGNNVSAFYIKNLSPYNSISKVTVSAVFGQYVKTFDVEPVTGKTYYTESEGVYTEVETPTAVSMGTYYELSNANDMIRVAIFTKDATASTSAAETYTLLGVLGSAATTGTAVGEAAFNKNIPYFTRSGEGTAASPYVYAQDKEVTADNFATKKATLYTCANTAAYGATSLFDDGDAVKDLDYYTNVKTSLDIVTVRSTGSTELAAGYEVDMVAVVWLDGTMLNDSRQGQVGTVYLNFAA